MNKYQEALDSVKDLRIDFIDLGYISYVTDSDIENLKELVDKETKKEETKPTVQTTCSDSFTEAIKDYLDSFAKQDEHFKERYANPKKSIVECCAYIVGQVQKMRVLGLDDNEVYQMARHYYLEDISKKDLQVSYQPNRVISNKHVDIVLTEEDKTRAKEDAVKEYQQKIKEELRKKEEKEAEKLKKLAEQEKEKADKKQVKVNGQLTLFDL